VSRAMTIDVNMAGFDAMLDGIDDDINDAVRPAAQAAAQVLYEAALKNAKSNIKTGNLSRAIYQVYSKDNSGEGRATYHISWNAKIAPHGHLVEFGHIQRYAVRMAPNGQFYTLVRPSMRGKPKPRRSASQAQKDAYYVTLATPRQVAAQPFIRPAQYRAGEAQAAAAAKFYELVGAR
jgi:hypothetical protein